MSNYPGAVQYPVRWWGYPSSGKPRRIKPTVLLVVHITGNSSLPSAMNEAIYSNRDGSGASFTFVTNRDGSIVQCLQPETQTPWTNGDINAPNTSIPTVKAMVGSAYNPNEFCFMTCENVGYEWANPITAAQKETLARLAAWGSKISGLPVNRSTVIGHRDINSVTRHGCPTAGDLEAFLGGIINRANQILGGLPDTSTGDNVSSGITVTAAYEPDRVVSFAAGTYIGYHLDGSIKKATLTDASSAHARMQASITQSDGRAPHGGPFIYIVDGIWAGYFMAQNQAGLTLGPEVAVDCSAAVKTAVDPLNAKIATLTSQVSNLNSRLSGVKSKTAAFAADVAND